MVGIIPRQNDAEEASFAAATASVSSTEDVDAVVVG